MFTNWDNDGTPQAGWNILIPVGVEVRTRITSGFSTLADTID